MKRLSRAAPEEIAVAVVLVVVLALAALRPASIGRLFESPYATPAPSGGPALDLLRPSPTASPVSAGEVLLLLSASTAP